MLVPRFTVFFALIFAVSGLTGLIYESIWTQYLKLFLGHAAYAQSLVLAIFMGGMSLGAYLAAKYSRRWKNLLITYAVVEALIGLAAMIFHETFDAFLQLSYHSILPAISSPVSVQMFKWIAASLLIFPQTILLGMTFPLMTAGMVRFLPDSSGRLIALLYFTNSIGAAGGVLVSGFLLIDWFGLPGTIKLAGLLNFIIAALVVLAFKKNWFLLEVKNPPAIRSGDASDSTVIHNRIFVTLLVVALGTGLASFIYEISWIRMLSLVLGSSTHAFEIMLSAFILGIALGGLWIYRRIQFINRPLVYLAHIQVIMGLLALATLPLYNLTFDAMQGIVSGVDKDSAGYALFNIGSHALALTVMLPATFCAGMTLPLITHILLKERFGEQSIGFVYAFNTVGAILGVFICVHILLPLVGLKLSIMTGALIDILIGCGVLYLLVYGKSGLKDYRYAVSALVIALLCIPMIQFDSFKMASGVYRHGNFYSADNAELLFHKDGKTASVDLVRVKSSNEVSIITNGKPDASINVSVTGTPSPDEATMVLLAGLPLALNPDSRMAAVVGLGSGLTSHVLLNADNLTQVDTVEIESAIVEAARAYKERVSNVYNSPKSRIFIDDAKSFFSNQGKKYDIIISEPSNPWVSGVASLFTVEFYSLAKSHLTDTGIFAQWLQLYEIDLPLVASVVNAISSQFSDYVIYAANNQDIVILASKSGKLPQPSGQIFNYPALASDLSRVRVRNVQDMSLRKLGDKQYFDPFFRSYSSITNSDYYPVLDLNATRTRFLQKHALQLITLADDPVYSQEIITQSAPVALTTNTTASRFFYPSDLSFVAMIIRDFLLYNRVDGQFYKLPEHFKQNLMRVKAVLLECSATASDSELLNSIDLISNTIMPYLTAYESSSIWSRLTASPCLNSLPAIAIKKMHLQLAISKKDVMAISAISGEILEKQELAPDVTLLTASMIGNIGLNRKDRAEAVYKKYIKHTHIEEKTELLVRLLKSHAELR